MKVTYKHWKNSNTGHLLKTQEFTETDITGIPVYFYDADGKKCGENLELVGYVEVSEKKFNRESKKLKT